jgi:hypothetical protein
MKLNSAKAEEAEKSILKKGILNGIILEASIIIENK